MNTYYCDFPRGDIQRAWDYAAQRNQFGHNVRVVVLAKQDDNAPTTAFRVFFSASQCDQAQAINVKDVPERS